MVPAGATGAKATDADARSLRAVFEPRRVAVVGASDRPGKVGTTIMENLAGFSGEVVPISTSSEQVGGGMAYPTLGQVPGHVDLVVAVVPAAAVPAVVEDAASAETDAVVVISGGFAETGPEGAELQRAVVASARAGGVRIVGPNCLGVQNCHTGLNASMAAGTLPEGGDIALATQSGAYGMAIHTLGLEHQMRFSKVYAAGNKADIGDAEVLAYLGADPDSKVLCFFLESLEDGRAFYEQARAIAPRKPILMTRTGRTEAGARAALSHTAALAGRAVVWQAALAQAGIVLARSGLEMMDAARALDWQPPPAGNRVGVITNSGGTGVELTDLLSDEGMEVPELSAALQEELAPALPAFASPRNPVDVTPAWDRFADMYPLCIERLARSGEVDAVVAVLLQRSATDAAVGEAVRDAAAALRDDGVAVPVYVCWVAPEEARANRDLLQAGGVPCFEWPTRTARAVGHARRWALTRAGPRATTVLPDRPAGLAPVGEGVLAPAAAAELVRAFGIGVPAQAVCEDAGAVLAAAGELGYPVVLKAVAPELVHKSDAGAVRVGLGDDEELRSAAEELLARHPGATLLVQAQEDGVEVIVGGFRDPQFGPVVMVGLGGVLVEVLEDVAFRVAPIDEPEAREALESLRGHALLGGVRGRPAVDETALAGTVAAASRLIAAVPEMTELDLNPVFASPSGAVAVDVRVVAGPPASRWA